MLAHRLALALCAATFVLILIGGLVTNTGAALAVPDWPTTFGYNMFLFPWSKMVGGILYGASLCPSVCEEPSPLEETDYQPADSLEAFVYEEE